MEVEVDVIVDVAEMVEVLIVVIKAVTDAVEVVVTVEESTVTTTRLSEFVGAVAVVRAGNGAV